MQFNKNKTKINSNILDRPTILNLENQINNLEADCDQNKKLLNYSIKLIRRKFPSDFFQKCQLSKKPMLPNLKVQQNQFEYQKMQLQVTPKFFSYTESNNQNINSDSTKSIHPKVSSETNNAARNELFNLNTQTGQSGIITQNLLKLHEKSKNIENASHIKLKRTSFNDICRTQSLELVKEVMKPQKKRKQTTIFSKNLLLPPLKIDRKLT